MPPLTQYPAPAPQEPEKNPYDFFMEQQKQPKKSLLSGGRMSGKKMLLIISGIVLLLIILGAIGIMLLGPKEDTAPELSVVQTQQEIVRVATDGAKNTKTGNLQNFAVTTSLAVTSSQQEYLGFLASRGLKIEDKELALGHNTKTDQALAAALAANTYDTTFSTIMKAELDSYAIKLQSIANTATSAKAEEIIKKLYAGAQLLRKQLEAQ